MRRVCTASEDASLALLPSGDLGWGWTGRFTVKRYGGELAGFLLWLDLLCVAAGCVRFRQQAV